MRRLHHQTTNRNRPALAALILSIGLVASGGPTPASAAPPGKTTICHATASATNPYVRISVSSAALASHAVHQDGRDIIPAPPTCPDAAVPPPVTDVCPNLPGDQPVVPDLFDLVSGQCVPEPNLEFIPCVVSAGVMQTATTVTGTPADDTIDCSAASPGKTIETFAGNDTVTGTAFVDVVTSGDGNDTLSGLDGDDVLAGGDGNNTITGGLGNDTITAGTGSDTLTGSEGDDSLDGGTGIDTISGGPGDDDLVGPNDDSSVDTVSGGDGTNDVCTGPGSDFDIVSGCETQTP
jgi:RTX calcium-binding nonapeptide repeat (4 copies)